MKKMSKEERKIIKKCFEKYFQAKCTPDGQRNQDCTEYNVKFGNRNFRTYLTETELSQIIDISIDIMNELQAIYAAGLFYNKLMQSMDDYGVIVTDDGTYDNIEPMWDAKFCTEQMLHLINRVQCIQKNIDPEAETTIIPYLEKVIFCCYIAMTYEYEKEDNDATIKYLYVIITTIMRVGEIFN